MDPFCVTSTVKPVNLFNTMIQYNFEFSDNTYNYWPLYETIKEYYPIGIVQREGTGIHSRYSGRKKLNNIVVENIHDENNFQNRWVAFSDELGKEFGLETIGTAMGQAPSFSSSLVLFRNTIDSCTHIKSLEFSVSLLGEYFQVYGIDMTIISEENHRGGYSQVNVVTASPYKEFKDSFEFVEKKIREKYLKYKLVPISVGQSIIKGLQVYYLNDEKCTVNVALFNQFLSDFNIANPLIIRGDKHYGEKDWRI